MASIRDVAKKAGVAVATVSRYMNGTANVSEETQQRIEAAMQELQYIPNELARSMFKKKSNTIAMLVPNIQHPWFSSLAAAIEKELNQRNYRLMLFSTSDDTERERECLHTLRSNIVDGIICGTSACAPEEYQAVVDKPIVMLDFKISDDIPLIVSDHKQGGRLAAEAFIRSGCRNVIHISGERTSKDIYSFYSHEVLDEVLGQAGIATRLVPIQWNAFDFDGYFELAKTILDQYPQVDGLMAADLPALAFVKAARALGKIFPEDFSVVAYDGTYVLNTNTVNISRIRQPYELKGKKAVGIIMDQLQGKNIQYPCGEVVLPVEFVQGETTA